MLRFLFLLLFLFVKAGAEENLDSIQNTASFSVASSEGLPSNIVAGCVCAITGEYIENEVDFTVKGPEPLIFQRIYSSFADGTNWGGYWSHNHQDIIRMTTHREYEQKTIEMLLVQPSSACLSHKIKYKESKELQKIRIPFTTDFPKGMANSSFSGRHNIKNQKAFYYPTKEGVDIKVDTASGDRLHFQRWVKNKDEPSNVWYLNKKVKVNGQLFKYNYDEKNLLTTQISALAGRKLHEQLYAWITFNYDDAKPEEPVITLKTSEGQQAKYFFSKHKFHEGDWKFYRSTLEKVERSNGPSIAYKYVHKTDSKRHLIKKRKEGKNFREISYYRTKDCLLGPLPKEHLKKGDFRLDRVLKLEAPVGTDSTPIPTHYFTYHIKKEDDKIVKGKTDVYNALLHKTSYHYDKHHRLTFIERFKGAYPNHSLHSSEHYVWGRGDQEGNLLGKYLKDGAGNIHSARYFVYDEFGNVLTDVLCGELTGQSSPPLVIPHTHPIQNGHESCGKKYTYFSNHLLQSEEEYNGKKTLYSYDGDSERLTAKIVTFQGKTEERNFYFYDENSVLIRTVTDDGLTDNPNDLTNVTCRRIIQHRMRKEAPINLPELTDEIYLNNGKEELLKRVINHYSSEGNLVQQDHYDSVGAHRYSLYWEYNQHGKLTKEVNAIGHIIFREYDENDRLVRLIGPKPNCWTTYTYDYSNRLIKEETRDDTMVLTISHRYDYLGNRIATIDPSGNETNFEYDEFGRVIKIILPPVLKDDATFPRPVLQKAYDVAGHLCLEMDPKGHPTAIQNNIRGQKIKATYVDGSQERWIYTPDGQLAQKIEKNGTITTYTRDYNGKILQENIYDANLNLLKSTQHTYKGNLLLSTTDPENLKTEYTHDGAGRIKTIIKGDQYLEQTYDPLGRVCQIKEWYGYAPHEYRIHKKEYDNLDRILVEKIETADGKMVSVTGYAYDEVGNTIGIQQGEVVVRTTYDGWKRPIKTVDHLGNTTYISYNHHFRNSVGQTVLQKITTDPLGNLTFETYNTQGNLAEILNKNAMGAITAQQIILYDENGNKTHILDPAYHEGKHIRSAHTALQYDPMNRLIAMTEATGTPDQKLTRYHYNPFGQMARLTKPSGIEIFSKYNSEGILSEFYASDESFHYVYHYNKGNLPIEVTDLKTGLKTTRTYNLMGEMETETLANGLSIAYNYDRVGRLSSVQLPDSSFVEYQYDATNLKQIRRNEYTYSVLAHNYSGQPLKIKQINNKEYHYKYDPLDRLVNITSNDFNVNVQPDGYDRAGNLLKYTENNQEHTFSYDDLYQLSSENEHDYQYDSLSNRLKKDNLHCQCNTLNQTLSQGNDIFIYDPNGNLVIQALENGKTILYEYDALDRLIKMSSQDDLVEYAYDSFNRRIACNEKKFFYQGNYEIGLVEDDTIKELKILNSGEPGKSIAIELNGEVYETVHDLFSNVVQLADINGNIIETYDYTAFGEETIFDKDRNIQQKSTNPWRYADRRIDEETGLVLFGLRYYNPQTGTWITRDPIGYEDGPNLYAYVHANPLLYFDSLGLISLLFSTPLEQNFNASFSQVPSGYPSLNSYKPPKGIFRNSAEVTALLDYISGTHRESTEFYGLDELKNPETGAKFKFQEYGNLGAIYSNGINTPFLDFTSNMAYLSKFTEGIPLSGIHNASHGPVIDAYRYITTTWLKHVFSGAQKLQNRIESFFKDRGNKARLLLVGNSYGCCVINQALEMIDPTLRKRISVIAISPGQYIDRNLCRDVIHYVSHEDIVPVYARGKSMAMEQGTIRYFGDPNGSRKSSFTVHDMQHRDPAKIRRLKTNIEEWIAGGDFSHEG